MSCGFPLIWKQSFSFVVWQLQNYGQVVYSGLIKVTLILKRSLKTTGNVTTDFPDITALGFWGKYWYSMSSSGCQIFIQIFSGS